MKHRILVLGGTGLLGPEVCRVLRLGGGEVLAFNRGAHRNRLPEGVDLMCGDRRRLEDLGTLSRVEADVVVDTAGWYPETLPDLLSLLLGRTRLYVFVSSIAVYCAGGEAPLSEEAPLGKHPVWGDVGQIKQEGEKAVTAARAQGLPVVVLRLAHLCSADPAGREARLASLLRNGAEILVPDDGAARLQFVKVHDVACLCQRLAYAPSPPSPCYNVAAEENWTIRGWIEAAARHTGHSATLRFLPFNREERQRFLYWPGNVVVDGSRLARELGFRPRPPRFPVSQEVHY